MAKGLIDADGILLAKPLVQQARASSANCGGV